jgi:predicted MPP superfamily phosphohydrolase
MRDTDPQTRSHRDAGDLVDDRPEDVAHAKIFGALDAPFGVYIIPGNHDVYAGWEAIERELRAANSGRFWSTNRRCSDAAWIQSHSWELATQRADGGGRRVPRQTSASR